MKKKKIEDLQAKVKWLLDESTEANWTVNLVDRKWDISFECICDRGYTGKISTGYAEGNKSTIGTAFVLAMPVHLRWFLETMKVEHPEQYTDEEEVKLDDEDSPVR